MAQRMSVKVSGRYQIALPSIARRHLNIQAGDRLLVDIQDGLLILLPQPQDYVAHMAGLHREVWDGLDTAQYINEERDAWDASASD
jgi:AbrB family looped-hinge helix DNA binding protein